MRKLNRTILSMLALLTLVGSVSVAGCYAEEYRDGNGRAYRHARWHDEHVYQHEDGRWYARRNNGWVVVDARIE
jgi:hypothetical protein